MIEATGEAGVSALVAAKTKLAKASGKTAGFAALLTAEPEMPAGERKKAESKRTAEERQPDDAPLPDTLLSGAPMADGLTPETDLLAPILAAMILLPPDTPADSTPPAIRPAVPTPAPADPAVIVIPAPGQSHEAEQKSEAEAPHWPAAFDAESVAAVADGDALAVRQQPPANTIILPPPATRTDTRSAAGNRPAMPAVSPMPPMPPVPPVPAASGPSPADAIPAAAAAATASVHSLSRRPARALAESPAPSLAADSAPAGRPAAVSPPISTEVAGPNVPFSFDSGGLASRPGERSGEVLPASPPKEANPVESASEDGFTLETPLADIAIRQRAERGLDVLLRAADNRAFDHLTDQLPQLEAQLQAIGAEVDGVRVEPRPAPMATAWGAGANGASADGSGQSGARASGEGMQPRQDQPPPAENPGGGVKSASGPGVTGKVDRYA